MGLHAISQGEPSRREHRTLTPTEWLAACSMAAIGGMLPTLSRIAGSYVTNPASPLPQLGLLVGLAIFALIGIVLCIAFRQTDLKQALIVGISAPGIVTNIVGGISDGQLPQPGEAVANVSEEGIEFESSLIPNLILTTPALAQDTGTLKTGSREAIIQYSQRGLATSEAVKVYAKTRNPRVTPYLGILGRASTVTLPEDTTALLFRSSTLDKTVDVPDEGSFVLQISTTSRATAGKDFLWALGQRRSGSIVELDVDVVKAWD